MSRQHKTPAFARMFGAVALVLLLLDEAASFSLPPPSGRRPPLCTPTGRIWPGPGGCGGGPALRGNTACVADRRSGGAVQLQATSSKSRKLALKKELASQKKRDAPSWVVGDGLGGGAISVEATSRQTAYQLNDGIKRCKDLRKLAELVTEYGERFNHVNVVVAWQTMAKLPPGEEDKGLAAALQDVTRKVMGKMFAHEVATALHVAGSPQPPTLLPVPSPQP